jgi:hypothetical protein
MSTDRLPPAKQTRITPAETYLEQKVTASGNAIAWTVIQGRPQRMLLGGQLSERDSKKFRQLVDEWRRETFFSSSLTNNLSHPAYLTIMAMGQKGLPLILQELEKHGGQWTTALRYIVDRDEYPDKPEDVGKPRELKEAWLAWGRQNNFL